MDNIMPKKSSYASEFARKGGIAAARSLTPEQRIERARNASLHAPHVIKSRERTLTQVVDNPS